MKTFYEKLRKGIDCELYAQNYLTTKDARRSARLASACDPNLDIHIRKGNRLILKARCIADSWFCVATAISSKSPLREFGNCQESFMAVMQHAKKMVKARETMRLFRDSVEVYPIQVLKEHFKEN